MDTLSRWDVHLTRDRLQGRTFLLGNKRAFSLSLPAASGSSSSLLHPHKWFGAYLYGRKFLEGQIVRLADRPRETLCCRQQTGLTVGLTAARRHYEIDGASFEETFFVPDGVQGFACTLSGGDCIVEPEFDIRFYRALPTGIDSYRVEPIEGGAVISNVLPSGSYDDATETFLPGEEAAEPTHLYAAVQVVGDESRADLVPEKHRLRRKRFRKDAQRHRFLAHSAAQDASDHAPLWDQSGSVVYAPLRLQIHGHGAVLYGFGASRDEALGHLAALRDNLTGYQAQKSDGAAEILAHARLETGSDRVDTAYVQVLNRLMDALVARHAVAEDTALDRPATMILAGNQYFHDSWKRDENIALGFLLALGFYDLARDVIADTWQLQDESTGRLPQRIRAGEVPPYHSSDGTLWALWRLYQYSRCSGDELLLREKLPMVQRFFARSVARTVDGLLPSGRTTAPDYLWETWMDTPHTPRDGFPVEIQMLWIACLRVFRPILAAVDPALERDMTRAEMAAWQTLRRFNVRGMPADSLDSRLEARDLITPNPYFCFGVGLDLGPEVERSMREMGRRQLAGRQGIITLAPEDWGRVFSPEFLGDRRNVRGRRMRSIGKFNYHRGVEWNWLSQFFVRAELKYGEPDVAFRKYLRPQVSAALERGGVGGIGELFDLSGTRGPDFQAWSMAGFLEAVHAFAGVQIDVPARRITVEPHIPASWPRLALRKWYGRIPFDLRYEADGMARALRIDFPWGESPDADIEIALLLPARHSAQDMLVRLDGVRHDVTWWQEPIPGSGHARLRVTVPAAARVEIGMTMERAVRRAASARSA